MGSEASRLLEGVTRTVEYYDRHRAHYWNANA